MNWRKVELSEIATIERGRFSPRPRNDPRYYGGKTPFVQTGDIGRSGGVLREFSQTLNDDGLKVSKLFPARTILITIAANIGDTAITEFPVACPDSLVGIQPNAQADPVWLNYYLQTKKKHLDSLATQNAQKNINLEVLKPLSILLPPLPEQRKIAEILSCWDRGSECCAVLKKWLETLLVLAAKRLLRKKDGWIKVSFNDLFQTRNEKEKQIPTSDYQECGQFPVVDQGKQLITAYTDRCDCLLEGVPFIVFGDHTREIKWVDFPFVAGADGTQLITTKHNFNNLFGYFVLKNLRLPNLGYARHFKIVKEASFWVPDSIVEQGRIADTLMTLERYINQIVVCQNLLNNQKQGLMQKLLTGKVRVKL